MTDILEQCKLKRKEKILRMKESYNEWNLYCPHCGHEQSDLWEFHLDPQSEEWKECDCQKCERTFMGKAEIRFSSRPCK